MSDEKQETMADIVADIRERAENAMRNGERLVHNEAVANMLTFVADRIEAAWKRDEERAVEHATRHAEAVARDNCRDCVHNPRGRNYEGGNAAAMREGLIWMKERIIAAIHDGSLDCSEVLNKIEDALSAPARNCDLYASATEALKAQDVAFNEDNFKNGECKLGCPGCDDGLIDCKILWLFAPAEKRKGESDGR